MYRINEFLTPRERAEAIRVGALRKLASLGMTPSDFSRQMKKSALAGAAAGVGAAAAGKMAPLLSPKTLFSLAIYLGIPLGALSYGLKSSFSPETSANSDLKTKLDEMNDIVEQYRRQLG
jgi:hypothetical protein